MKTGGATKLIACALISALMSTRASAADARVDIVVRAKETKRNNDPWDGSGTIICPDIFGVPVCPKIPESPPDLKIGVVRPDGSMAIHEGNDCRDALECTFHDVPVPAGTFGLLIVDVDAEYHDLVDVAVFADAGSRSDAPVRSVERWLRHHARRHAPTGPIGAITVGDPFDTRRPVLAVDSCPPDDPCPLRQSSVAMEIIGGER